MLIPEQSPARALLDWYRENGRDLPWRGTQDPYEVLVSEVMLQQTRAGFVAGRYERFIARFPDAATLAAADEEEVLKEWEGLGYYRRARNLHRAARYVVSELGGVLPDTVDGLLCVPGIGPYTAGAVAAIAYGRVEPAVDANVLRIFGRQLALDVPVSSAEGKRAVDAAVRSWLPEDAPGDFAQALMDLGSGVCTPRRPHCDRCPISEWCEGRRRGIPEQYPVRAAKANRRSEEWTALILTDGRHIGLVRRPESGLLSGLYGPPLLEGFVSEELVRRCVRDNAMEVVSAVCGPEWTHVFTHVTWRIRSWVVRVRCTEKKQAGVVIFTDAAELREERPVPSAFRPCIRTWEELMAQNDSYRAVH